MKFLYNIFLVQFFWFGNEAQTVTDRKHNQYILGEELLLDDNDWTTEKEELYDRFFENDQMLAKKMELSKLYGKPIRRKISQTYSIVQNLQTGRQDKLYNNDELEEQIKECLKRSTFVDIIACLVIGETSKNKENSGSNSTITDNDVYSAVKNLSGEIKTLKQVVQEVKKLLDWLVIEDDIEEQTIITTKIPEYGKTSPPKTTNAEKNNYSRASEDETSKKPYQLTYNESTKTEPTVYHYRNGLAGTPITNGREKSLFRNNSVRLSKRNPGIEIRKRKKITDQTSERQYSNYGHSNRFVIDIKD